VSCRGVFLGCGIGGLSGFERDGVGWRGRVIGQLLDIARPPSIEKFNQAIALVREGVTLSEIARRIGVARSTLHIWTASQRWAEENARLDLIEQQAAAELAMTQREQYKAQLLKSRDILQQVADSGVQTAGAMSIASAKAVRVITQKLPPEEAITEIAKGGAAYVAQTAAAIAKVSADQLDRIYAIDKILEYLDANNS